MPFDGSGVFNRLYNWTDDRDSSVPILASKMDSETNGIAAAINAILNGSAPFLNPFKTVNGSAATPAFSFTSDSDTGMYRSAANELSFSTGGVLAYKIANNQVVIFENTPKVGGADVSLVGHTHDFTGDFAPIVHTHDFTGDFAPIVHTHDFTGDFAPISHSHGESDLPDYLGSLKVPDVTADQAVSGLWRFNAGVQLGNSNITQVNRLMFNDTSGTAEGIGFLKTGAPADSANLADYEILRGLDGDVFYDNIKLVKANTTDFLGKNGDGNWDLQNKNLVFSKSGNTDSISHNDATNEFTFQSDGNNADSSDVGSSKIKAYRARLECTNDASVSSTAHALQIGPDSGVNLAIDNNEIYGRNNGIDSPIMINQNGFRKRKTITWNVGTSYSASVPHNLGGPPNLWAVYAEFETDEDGWIAGDKTLLGAGEGYYGSNIVVVNDTHVKVAMDSRAVITMVQAAGGSTRDINKSNLKVVVILW